MPRARSGEEEDERREDRRQHPNGVLSVAQHLAHPPPLRNYESCRQRHLGLLALLPDETILAILSLLPPRDVVAFGGCSTWCTAFAQHEDLWRNIALSLNRGVFRFRYTWRETAIRSIVRSREEEEERPGAKEETEIKPQAGAHASFPRSPHVPPPAQKRRRVVPCGSASSASPSGPRYPPHPTPQVVSDILAMPWLYATSDIDPTWLEVENIDRLPAGQIDPREFRTRYEEKNRPVLLSGAAAHWPALSKWTDEYVDEAYGAQHTRVSNAPMPIAEYRRYVREARDEQPVYLFDPDFVEHAPRLARDFTVPDVFEEDWFRVLGERRPLFRWLIAGPPKSGSR